MQEFIEPSLGLSHFAFDTIGSTNDEAFRLAKTRNESQFFVTAKRQTDGRGRRGRTWVSQAGNLYTSLYIKSPAEAERCAELSFVAAVALFETIQDCAGDIEGVCTFKWPNDILWNGAKIAGLLLEANEKSGEIDIVIGMGVNCTHHPENTPYPATDFKSEGLDIPSEKLFEALMPRLMKTIQLWNRGQGFSAVRAMWLKHASGIGQTITVRLESEEISGVFREINERGQLVLDMSDKSERIITAGDVFFPTNTG